MIRVGIVGGAGYTAGELLRILVNHPEVELAWVVSGSHAGKPISTVHSDLQGIIDLHFVADYHESVDAVFLCTPHGKSAEWLSTHPLPAAVKVIDLSNDFRLAASGNKFVYGLPERNRSAIQRAQYVANPGCFATAVSLALLPLSAIGLIQHSVHVSAITGSTGAGRELSETTHFSWRANNLSVYKPFTHQHIPEIRQSWFGFDKDIHFIPYRGPFTRGIFASIYTRCTWKLPDILAEYQRYYADAPFTHVSDTEVELKQVVGTNRCLLHLHRHNDQLLVTSVIDNLTKGASGQAVQNLNLMFGLAETTGLNLRALAF